MNFTPLDILGKQFGINNNINGIYSKKEVKF